MAEIIADEEWLCVDCGMIVANDDGSGIEDEAAHRARMAAHYSEIVGYMLVLVGCAEDGCEYADRYPGENSAPHTCRFDRDFSSAECAGCGTTLAGHRFAAVVLS